MDEGVRRSGRVRGDMFMKKRMQIGVAVIIAVIVIFGIYVAAASGEIFEGKMGVISSVPDKSKITAELLETMDKATAAEKIRIYVWLEDISEEELQSAVPENVSRSAGNKDRTAQEYLKEKRSYVSQTYAAHNCDILNASLAEVLTEEERSTLSVRTITASEKEKIEFVSSYSPLAVLNLNRKQICELSKQEQVKEIGLVHMDMVRAEQSDSKQAIQADYVHTNYGYKGEGVAVGILEANGIPDSSNSEFSHTTIISRTGGEIDNFHATKVACIIVGKEYGIAPECTLYAVQYSGNFYADVEWLLSQGVSVINASLGFGSTKDYKVIDQWVDHIDMNHDVLFVKSAGNDVNNNYVTSPGFAYNGIAVGAYYDYGSPVNHSDDELWNGSGYRENDGLAEKPDLVAPGQEIYFPTLDVTSEGTSYAAPMVAATAALMIEANPDLVDEPGVLKSILLASAFRKLDSYSYNVTQDDIESAWISDTEGVGKLDTKNALYVVMNGRHKYEYLYDYMFPYTSSFYVNASENQIRVALCWLKQNVYSSSSLHYQAGESNPPALTEIRNLSNLDLEIYDPNGNLVGYSRMDNGNVELVEFDPLVTGWYTIKVVGTDLKTSKDFIYLAWW